MPTYNRWSYVAQRIEELRAAQEASQSIRLALIVVDDHSATFCPPRILRSIYEIGGRYLRLHRNSGSVSIPRAIGIAHSSGEFIAHVDDDVVVPKHRFESLIPHFLGGVDLVYGAAKIQHVDGTSAESFIPDWNPSAEHGWGVDGGQFVYRRSVFNKVPLHFAMRGCDWELAKRIYTGANFRSVNSIVSNYIWHGGNRSLDETTKHRHIFPQMFRMYFRHWPGTVDYTPIAAR